VTKPCAGGFPDGSRLEVSLLPAPGRRGEQAWLRLDHGYEMMRRPYGNFMYV
jgi:hypothetical protein